MKQEDKENVTLQSNHAAIILIGRNDKPDIRLVLAGGRHVDLACHAVIKVASPDSGLRYERADDVTIGDFVALQIGQKEWPMEYQKMPEFDQSNFDPRVKRISVPEVLDEELAWAFGAWTADGSVIESNWTISIVKPDEKLIERFVSVMRDRFDVHAKVSRCKTKNGTDYWRTQIVSKSLVSFIKQIGFTGKSHTKIIPEIILDSASECN